jgi:hypothetical protein
MRHTGGIVVLCVFCCANAAGQWRVVPESNRPGVSRLRDGAPDSTATFIASPGNRERNETFKEVMVIYDQPTNRTWWDCGNREVSVATGAIYPWTVVREQNGSALVGFVLLGQELLVKRSTTEARSYSEAQTRVLDALAGKTKESLCGTSGATASVSLKDVLPYEFFFYRYSERGVTT